VNSAPDKDAKQTGAADNSAGELAIIARILAGERELFHDLIRPYERGLYLAAYSIMQHEADAEDIAQEAVIKAYKALKNFRGESKFSTWLMANHLK
jgi:RNA polymerase sigma-70 factor (ECF subfamily)